jgi:hypothetical protein
MVGTRGWTVVRGAYLGLAACAHGALIAVVGMSSFLRRCGHNTPMISRMGGRWVGRLVAWPVCGRPSADAHSSSGLHSRKTKPFCRSFSVPVEKRGAGGFGASYCPKS